MITSHENPGKHRAQPKNSILPFLYNPKILNTFLKKKNISYTSGSKYPKKYPDICGKVLELMQRNRVVDWLHLDHVALLVTLSPSNLRPHFRIKDFDINIIIRQ